MFFTSTRARSNIDAAAAIARGISAEGGLFVPSEFPALTPAFIARLIPMTYRERAAEILSLLLPGFTREEVRTCVDSASTGTFDDDAPAPLRGLVPGTSMLELWHGPTCAFKDLALQILPFLLTKAVGKSAPGRTAVILVATSGDTGKAALAGFADVPGTKIIVFFPQNGVSPIQKLQMTTQEGANTGVCAIEGNFDDAQSGVKKIFADGEMARFLAARNMAFSSANSINFGRLAPQIVYYVSAYCDMVRKGDIVQGAKVNAAVPTGNFGNILAAVYAKRMGLPLGRLICASNRNNILTDFLRTGVYDRNRPFYTTSSPSMDILISSNLERLLYHLHGNDPGATAALMAQLASAGRYEVSPAVLEQLKAEFYGGFCDETDTRRTIGELFREPHYLCDPHTAVAVKVHGDYVRETGDDTPCVIASTASAFKFARPVLESIDTRDVPEDDFAALRRLADLSGQAVPRPLAGLGTKEVRHRTCVSKEGMAEFIRTSLD